MGENQERRQAHRQKRGTLRQEEILQVTGAIFAEVGYDNTTTAMIATRAGISPGSLYQFFPNKEAITQAFATEAVQQLHQVYDAALSPEIISLPLEAFLDRFIDLLIAFNQQHPGYLALSLGSAISPALSIVLADLNKSVLARLDQVLAARWPTSTSEQRQLPLLVTYRIFLALLPLTLNSTASNQPKIVQELKLVLYRYLAPAMGAEIRG